MTDVEVIAEEEPLPGDLIGSVVINVTTEGWESRVTLPPAEAIFWLRVLEQKVLNDINIV